jgi:hypothetical protein
VIRESGAPRVFVLLVLVACGARGPRALEIALPAASGASPVLDVPCSHDPRAAPRGPLSAPPMAFGAGALVEVEWGGRFWPAVVLEEIAGPPRVWRIHYEGYGDEWDEVVGPERLRLRGEEGDAE